MWKLHETFIWEDLKRDFEFIKDMQGVKQDKEHHAEGDVEIHTQMVLKELINIEEFVSLTRQKQEILKAAALMHDIEKRSTTISDENGRISSKNHAKKGSKTVFSLLYKTIETPFDIRNEICNLVKYHGRPIWLLEKDDAQKELIKISLEVNTELLFILAKADVLGRISKDKNEILDRVELFKEYAKEQNCFGKKYDFLSPKSKFNYFNKENSYIDYTPFESDNFIVILMSAMPGSGKDYFINQNYPDLPVISLDDIRRKMKISPKDKKNNGKVVQFANEEARKYLRIKQSFIWNATNLTFDLRAKLIKLFTNYNAIVKIIYIEVPYKKLIEQNHNRPFPVPKIIMNTFLRKLEVPSLSEAHFVEYVVK
jgi:predicted kinase